MTVMVRDEVDVIAAWVEHHLAQGADLIIATDNGSIDGTTEVLQAYADRGVLELHHDPVFRKQQHAVVTGMARRAASEHGADWVINADADEFWVPCDKALTLRSALDRIPASLGAFTVPVINLVGPPALRGIRDRPSALARRADSRAAARGRHLRPADRRRRAPWRPGRHGVTGEPLRVAEEHRPARSRVRARGPPSALAVVVAIRAARRQHGQVVRGQPDAPSEQEPSRHGRLPPPSRGSTELRLPRPPAARGRSGRWRRGRCVRPRHLASGPSPWAPRSRAPAGPARSLPGRLRGRAVRARRASSAPRTSAGCSSTSNASATRRAGWPTNGS